MSAKYLHRVKDGYTYAGETDLRIMTCPTCGITYGIPQTMQSNAASRGEGKILWFCPNGHQLGYHGPSEADQERQRADRERNRADANRDLLSHTERRLAAQKGATTKAKKRHAAGVCPCCSRSFKQLRRHMASQHADYLAEHGIAVETDE